MNKILNIVLMGVLIMSVVIIPSKHIYGNPTYNTTNNIINGIEFEESYLNEIENSIVYTSNQLFCYDGRTYIGNNSGVNDSIYDVYGDIFDTESWFQFNFEIDLNKINALFLKNIDDIGITLEANCKNYIYNSSSGFKEDTYPETTNSIKLNYTDVTIPYHAYSDQLIGINAFNASIENNILKIRTQIIKNADRGSAIIQNRNYSLFYIQDFKFIIYKTFYNTKKTSKNIGVKSNISLESNELLSNNTFQSKFPYNEITYHNILSTNQRQLYVTSSRPVESDLSVKVSYYQSIEEPKYTTFTLSKNAIESTKVLIGLSESLGEIIEITPQKDSTYIYDKSILWNSENAITIGEYISNNIIDNYKKGKKRINIQVGYGDYYYDDGSPYGGEAGAKKLLQVGDIVQPMQWKNGEDVPFAINKDGTPMIFEITSAELDTNGAPKLFLQLLQKTT